MVDPRIEHIQPLLAYFGESDVEIFDSYDNMEDLCPVCGEVLEDGICPLGCDEEDEDLEKDAAGRRRDYDEDEEYEDDLDEVRGLGKYDDEQEE